MQWLKQADCKWISDEIRKEHLAKGLKAEVESEEASWSEVEASEDWTLVRNFGDYVKYYEFWGKTCWDALFQKPEFKGLTKVEAIEKFVNERLKDIVRGLGEEILDWEFGYHSLLIARISNTKGDAND